MFYDDIAFFEADDMNKDLEPNKIKNQKNLKDNKIKSQFMEKKYSKNWIKNNQIFRVLKISVMFQLNSYPLVSTNIFILQPLIMIHYFLRNTKTNT